MIARRTADPLPVVASLVEGVDSAGADPIPAEVAHVEGALRCGAGHGLLERRAEVAQLSLRSVHPLKDELQPHLVAFADH